MDVTPLVAQGQQIIQSYAGGVFKISGQRYEGPVLVYPSGTQDWAYGSKDGFSVDDFKDLIQNADDIDVVLLGCGADMMFLPADVRQSLKDKGLSVEIMPTGAACRTYNVLMAEGRRVVAALLPV